MRLLREPLLHFLVLGALVSAGVSLFDEDGQYRIDAGREQRERLASTYRQQYGAAPTDRQLTSLLDQYVRSEILYREGLALGLDRGDEIVRRRIVQKLEFVSEDAAESSSADDSALRGFFAEHRHRYDHAPNVSFAHLYFSPDNGGERQARLRAEQALAAITAGRDGGSGAHGALRGEIFADGAQFKALDRGGLNRLFGESPFVAAVLSAAPGTWSGPYRSGLGWHLVRVTAHQPARPASFDEAREQVVADHQRAVRQQLNDAEFRRLAAKYRIVADEPT